MLSTLHESSKCKASLAFAETVLANLEFRSDQFQKDDRNDEKVHSRPVYRTTVCHWMGNLFPEFPDTQFHANDAGYRPPCTNTIECAIDLIENSRGRVCIITGAGISSHALPTFRSNDHTGLWDFLQTPILGKTTFYDDPRPAWRLSANIRSLQLRGHLKPSLSHTVIHELLRRGIVSHVITQNVDSLHTFPGDESKVFELHGCVTDSGLCEACRVSRPVDLMRVLEDGKVPKCPTCNSVLKPPVAFFGDEIPRDLRLAANAAVDQSEVVILVGTHCAVDPVLSMVQEAKRKGALLIEMNTETTQATPFVDVVLTGKCDDTFATIARRILPGVRFEPVAI
jgi:NAD-dependent deacetylase